jgi:hypothetical protein
MRLASLALTALLLLALPAGAQSNKDFELGDLVDLPLFFKEMDNLEALRLEARQLMINLDNLMKKLGEQPEPAEEKKLRAEVQQDLLELRRIKKTHIEKVNPIIRQEPSTLSDMDVLTRLRDTSLGSLDWQNKYFKDACAAITEVTGVKIWMNPKVNQFNGVFLRMPNAGAGTVLKFICHGFDLKWIVFEGQIYITKKIGPNEDRLQAYEKRHGKIDYWRHEDDELEKVVDGRRVPQTVFDMDLGLLGQNLLKFFVLEEESRKHQEALKALKMEKKIVEKDQLESMDPKMIELAKTREKHLVHYLRMEKEGAIEVLDIIDRVLGDKVRLDEDEKQEWRRILDTPITGIAWEQMPLDEALYDLGRRINIPVVAEIPLIEVPYITLKVDSGTLETVIQMIQEIHPLTTKYTKGKIYFFAE